MSLSKDPSSTDSFFLGVLTTSIQIALESVVFANRFEIDEQEPLSRLEALAEQWLQGIQDLSNNGEFEPQALACNAAIMSTVHAVAKRVRTTTE